MHQEKLAISFFVFAFILLEVLVPDLRTLESGVGDGCIWSPGVFQESVVNSSAPRAARRDGSDSGSRTVACITMSPGAGRRSPGQRDILIDECGGPPDICFIFLLAQHCLCLEVRCAFLKLAGLL